MGEGEGRWSIWYNRDRPWIGDGDYETAELIERNFGPICPRGQKIVSSVCRLSMFMEEFTQSTSGSLEDHLDMPCTTQGLICLNRHQQQNPSSICNDYAIKFLCRDSSDNDDNDEGSPFPQFDVRIYIILAVVPILIFLIRILWAYVFRRRRQQRRTTGRGRRRRDNIDDDNSSIASALANPPPSYKELFGETGPNRSSVFAISGRNVPICDQCKEASCSVATAMQAHLKNSSNAVDTAAVSRSTSNSTTLTGMTPSNSTSISSNIDIPSDLSSSFTSSNSPSISDSPRALDSSNTQNVTSALVDDIERNDATAEPPNASHNIGIRASDSTQSDFIPSTSYVNMEDETNERSDDNNDNNNNNNNENSDNVSNHATTTGLSHNAFVQSNQHQQDQEPTQQSQQPILAPLSADNGLSPPSSSHDEISDPCGCTCHRTVPYKGREVTGYDNQAFHHHEISPPSSGPLDSSAMTTAGIHRVWSNLSTGSTLTLSELPSYQDALELIKTKEAEAMQTSNN